MDIKFQSCANCVDQCVIAVAGMCMECIAEMQKRLEFSLLLLGYVQFSICLLSIMANVPASKFLILRKVVFRMLRNLHDSVKSSRISR